MRKKKTSSKAPAFASDNIPRLKVIKGPHKGTVYKLIAGKVTIGRSSENDIVLINDNKCSRKQAIVNLGPNNTYFIKDASKKATMKINNMSKIKSDLQDGDLIQFGVSVLQFIFTGAKNTQHQVNPHVSAPSPIDSDGKKINPSESNNDQHLGLTPEQQPVLGRQIVTEQQDAENLPALQQDKNSMSGDINQNVPNYNQPPPPYYNPQTSTPPIQKKKGKQKKSLVPKIILLGLFIGGAWLFSQNTTNINKGKKDKIRTLQDMEEDIKTLSDLREQELQKRTKNLDHNYQYAQSIYIKGLRDYRKGVYIRAIESFRACKTLYPQHELCPSYLKKAQAKNQQLIQAWMIAGKEYREKRRFVPCMSSFKNVMMAVKNKNNTTYSEARENFKICQIQHEDRY